MLRAFVLCLGVLPAVAAAQDDIDPAALAEIRGELTALAGEIEALRAVLAQPDAQGQVAASTGEPAFLRLDRLEERLRGLTGEVEALRFRISRIVSDGTTRLGDLEFRLVELEGGDVSSLGETSVLGGADVPATTTPQPVEQNAPEVALAVGEQAEFDAAMAASVEGDYEAAIDRYSAFLQTYPGGPLSVQALYHRAEAMRQLGRHKDAARSYLDAFTAQPDGELSAQSLMRVGTSLGELGQTDQACNTLAEVLNRYPESDVVGDVNASRQTLGCL